MTFLVSSIGHFSVEIPFDNKSQQFIQSLFLYLLNAFLIKLSTNNPNLSFLGSISG